MLLLRLPMAFLLALLLVSCAVSPYSPEGREASAGLLHQKALDDAAQVRDRPISIVYLGFALHSGSQAFLGDVMATSSLVDRMTKNNVQLMFSNKQPSGQTKLPNATEYDLGLGAVAGAALADVIQKKGRQAFVIVLLSSHGSPGRIYINADGSDNWIKAEVLPSYLKPLERFPTLLIVSACYSGSLMSALQNDNRIVMTAASADRSSFGCESDSERTWFIDAMAKAFKPEETLQQWYEATASNVAQREKDNGYVASQPQLWVGKNMERYAASSLQQLDRVSQSTSDFAQDRSFMNSSPPPAK